TAGSTQAPAELLQDLQRILQSTYTPHRSYCRTYRGSCRAHQGHCRVYTGTCRATAGPIEDPAEHTTATAGSTQAPAEHVYPTQKLLQDLQRILQSTYTPHRSYCRTYRGSCRACTAPTT